MSVGEINALLNIVVLQLGDRSITLMQVSSSSSDAASS